MTSLFLIDGDSVIFGKMPRTGVGPTTLRFICSDAEPFSHKRRVETCGYHPYFVSYHYITFSDPPATASRPARLQVLSPASGKTPVQDPMTPTGYRPQGQGASPTQEAGSDSCEMVAITKGARETIQELKKCEETKFHAPLSTQEAGSDTRESESPTKDAREPIQEVEKSTEPKLRDVEAGSPTKEAREPIQVTTSKDGAEEERSFISKEETATVQARLPASHGDAQALIQELESPTKEAREPIQEVSPPSKEATMPAELTSEGEGSHGLPEGCTESRAQESRSQRSDEQLPSEDGSIRSAVEESKVTKGKEGELEVVPGRRQVFQGADLEDLSKGKKAAKEEALRKEEQDFEEFDKGKPLQETQETGKEKEEPSYGKPLQESESSSEVKNESPKKDGAPAQETMAAGEGPFEETGHEEGKALEETQGSVSKDHDNATKY